MRTRSIRVVASFVLCCFINWVATPEVVAQERQPTRSGGGADPASGLSFREGGEPIPSPSIQGTPGLATQIPRGMEGAGVGVVPLLLYQVHVLGEVYYAGTYRVTASTRMSEVVGIAGGVTPLGSERRVELRHGEQKKSYDLMRFKIGADLSQNPYVQDNDVIYVPLRKKTIRIVGAIKRPGKYELLHENNLLEALRLGGDFTVGAAREGEIQVTRFRQEKKEVLGISAMDEASLKQFHVENGDIIFIPHVFTKKNTFDFNAPKLPGDNIFYPSFEDRVFVLGGVKTAGAYSFSPYYNVSQYLSLAGGTIILSKRKRVIVRADGQRIKVRADKQDSVTINPGDTIFVPEKRLTPENWVALFMSFTSFALGTIVSVVAIKNL